jgi:hypothetical protein
MTLPADVLATAQRIVLDWKEGRPTAEWPATVGLVGAIAAALLAERRAQAERDAAICDEAAQAAQTHRHRVGMTAYTTALAGIAAVIRQRAADAETADHVDPLAGRAPRHGL